MRFVTANESGKSVKLHPNTQDRVYTDFTDDGKSVVIVAGRVVKVDEPSEDMIVALTANLYGKPPRRHPLLVETEEDPTPLPTLGDVSLSAPATKTRDEEEMELLGLADRLGFSITKESGVVGEVVKSAAPVAAPRGEKPAEQRPGK
jgi:hypothetical protein